MEALMYASVLRVFLLLMITGMYDTNPTTLGDIGHGN